GVSAADPLGIATTKAASGERTAALAAFGIRSGSGLAPESGKISPGHVALSTGAADDLNTREGGHVELAGQRLKVAAVSGDASYNHTPVVWTSLTDLQQLAGGVAGGSATVIALTTTDDADLAAADHRLDTETVSTSDALSAIGSYASENASL